jgi:LacI family transcriptional regulator
MGKIRVKRDTYNGPMARAPATPRLRVRMKDVAADAGVDTSLVSRLLSGDETLSVRPETEARVLEAVRRLGYRRNTAARTLKTSRTMALGMVLPGFGNVIYGEIARGAEERASAAGYVLLITGDAAGAHNEVLEDRVDGLLYATATTASVPTLNAPGAPPAILINRREPATGPSVIVDDEAGVAVATSYLASLGHRLIAHIAGPQTVDTARRRQRGFVDAMADLGLEVPDGHVVEAPFDERGGAMATATLLAGPIRPTAIVVANAIAAVGAMGALRRAGLAIPGDISIAALHEIPNAPYLEPPLTTVRMPLVELGRRAVDVLLGMIDGGAGSDVLVERAPELIVRESCAPPRP